MNNVTGNEIIHQYLRHNKKFPHVLCAGCGHGIVLGNPDPVHPLPGDP